MVSFKILSFGHNISIYLSDFVHHFEFLLKQHSFITTFSKNALDEFNIASDNAKQSLIDYVKNHEINIVTPNGKPLGKNYDKDSYIKEEDEKIHIEVPTFTFEEYNTYFEKTMLVMSFTYFERYLYQISKSILEIYHEKNKVQISTLLTYRLRGSIQKRLEWIKAITDLSTIPDKKRIKELDEIRIARNQLVHKESEKVNLNKLYNYLNTINSFTTSLDKHFTEQFPKIMRYTQLE